MDFDGAVVAYYLTNISDMNVDGSEVSIMNKSVSIKLRTTLELTKIKEILIDMLLKHPDYEWKMEPEVFEKFPELK